MEAYKMMCAYLDEHFPQASTKEIAHENNLEDADILITRKWLQKTWKIVIAAVPSIDPKYNNRLWYSIHIYEWSRTHSFWLSKSYPIRYYDTEKEALCYGLLQGLEIAKIKQEENGTTISK